VKIRSNSLSPVIESVSETECHIHLCNIPVLLTVSAWSFHLFFCHAWRT